MPPKEQSLKLKILSLQVKGEEESWILKAKSMFGFSETRGNYNASVRVDHEYFDRQVKDKQNEIAKVEAAPDLFDDSRGELARLNDDLKDIDARRKEAEKLEVESFVATIEVVDYSKSTITMRVPEEALLEIVKIRESFSSFVMFFM